MRWSACGVVALASLLLAASSGSLLGKPAPDFSLADLSDNLVRLNDFTRRQNVVLVFYVNHA